MTQFLDEIEAAVPALRRYARALTRDVDRADDLVQDCLERAIRKRGLWRPTGPGRLPGPGCAHTGVSARRGVASVEGERLPAGLTALPLRRRHSDGVQPKRRLKREVNRPT